MVDPEILAIFDHVQWLRTGQRAAEKLNCHQSTVSRATRRCQDIFGVQLIRESAEWTVSGDSELLDAEREVHQLWRWQKGLPLRIDSQHWVRDFYSSLDIKNWTRGNLNYLEYERPLHLLKSRVIDAWLCSTPDAPRDSDLQVFQLCTMPTLLVAKSNHPLFLHAEQLTLDDAALYPVLPLPNNAFPAFQALFHSLGFSHSGSLLKSACLADKIGDGVPAEDLFLGIASPLTLRSYESDWIPLPLEIPITVGDALVVRSEFAEHERTRGLVAALCSHLRQFAGNVDGVEVVGEPVFGMADHQPEVERATSRECLVNDSGPVDP